MDVGGLDVWTWSRICNLKTLTLKAGGLTAEEYFLSIKEVCIDCGIPGTLLEAFVGGPNPPPLYGGLWLKPKAIHPPEKAEESKVQLLVSAQMFGQVVMRVYNGNLGDSRIIP